MGKKRKLIALTIFLAIGIIFLGTVVGCSSHTNKQQNINEQQDINKQQVIVSTEKEGGETRVTCTLPQLTFNRLYSVETITVMDAKRNALPANHEYRNPTVSFVVPDDKLQELTLEAVYVDARALEETTKDPDKRIDWEQRFKQFKLSEILKNADSTKK